MSVSSARFLALTLAAVLLPGCGAEQGPSEPEARAAPDELTVTCGPDEPQVASPLVRPRSDGVHLRVVNPGAEALRVVLGEWSVTAGPGASQHVTPVPPGHVDVRCNPLEGPVPRDAPATRTRVVDPDGLYLPFAISCDHPDGAALSVIAGARGDPGSPADAARAFFARTAGPRAGGLAPGDVVEPAGYPGDPTQTVVRLVRAGEVIGNAQLGPDRYGGWIVSAFARCR